MVVGVGMRYFFGVPGSSVMYQPLMSTGDAVGLNSSIASFCGRSVWVRTSLTKIGGTGGSGESSAPGVPYSWPLGLQLSLRSHVLKRAVGSTITSEKPRPSVIGYQELL